MGYHRAGFDVVGVDIKPQQRYPFDFVQADAIAYVIEYGREFDAIHASPPCQAHSTITPDKSKHVDLIPETRVALEASGLPWVIENVAGARYSMRDPMLLCGSSFGLQVRRHRLFESNIWLTSLPCDHAAQGRPIGVYGSHGEPNGEFARPNGGKRGRKAADVDEAREVMGMPWASWHGAAQAIPPAYTEFIGAQLLAEVRRRKQVAA